MWSIKRQQFCMTIYTYNVFKSLIDFQYFTWNIEGDKYSFVNTNRICGVTLKDFMGFCIQLNIEVAAFLKCQNMKIGQLLGRIKSIDFDTTETR